MVAIATRFGRAAAIPWTARCASAEVVLEPEQADERLGVAALPDHPVELGERNLDDLDPLLLGGIGGLVEEVGGEVDVALLVGEAGRGVEARQAPPGACPLADLLGQLAPGRVERILARLVELAGGQLEQGGVVDRLPRPGPQGKPPPRETHPR